jgi:minor extracellular serine protease Vpr
MRTLLYNLVLRSIVFLLLYPILLSGILFSQENVSRWNKFDPFLQRMLVKQSLDRYFINPGSERPGPPSSYVNEEYIYHLVIHANPDHLLQSGIHLNAIHNSFVTARVDPAALYDIAGLSNVFFIEQGSRSSILLDSSLIDIHADLIHRAEGLEVPYTGSGVLIGIIDTGIDIFHPDFRNIQDQNSSRVISIWDLSLTPQAGESPPSGFNYGVEYTRADIEGDLINGTFNQVRSKDTNGHGTQVASIAGGNGALSQGTFTGVAPDAEFIVVQVPFTGISEAMVIDGLNYIFSIADDLNKPVAVNLSIGGHGGAHDGTASHEKAINESIGNPGRAVVIASGNSGNSKIHTGGMIEPTDTGYFTINIPSYSTGDDNYAVMLLYFENLDNQGKGPVMPAENLELRIRTPNGFTGTVMSGSEKITDTNDGRIILASQAKNEKNARLLYIELTDTEDGKSPAPGTWSGELIYTSGDGRVRYDMWYVGASFGSNITLLPESDPDYSVTIPGTADMGITVGSYVTKNSWLDAQGDLRVIQQTLGERSLWSGSGPTRDRRIKPDVMAPGHMITGALSADASAPTSRRSIIDGYVLAEGTSLSAPHVTGLTALLFEVNPTLTAGEILNILQSTSRSDANTPELPNQQWGYGKIDAYRAIIAAGAVVNVTGRHNGPPHTITLEQNYPNPFNPLTVIRYGIPKRAYVDLSVYTILGQQVRILVNEEYEAGYYEATFEASNLPSGVYIYRLKAGEYVESKKLLLLK